MHEDTTPTGALVIACRYCGAVESLPIDLEERVRYLRSRLANLALAKQRVHGFVRVLLVAWKRLLPPWLLLFVMMAMSIATQTVPNLLAFVRHPPAIPHAEQQMMLAEQILPTARAAFAMVVPAMALLAGYIYTRVRVRPLLQARPPRSSGGRPRCRCCGGSLTDARDAFLDCKWCGAQNIVTDKLARAKSSSADADARDYERSRDAATLDLHTLASWYRYVIYGVIVIVLLGQLVLSPIILALIQTAW